MFIASFVSQPGDTHVGQLFDDCLKQIRMIPKEAAAICGVSVDTIEKAITGERPVDLRWVQRMPWSFLSEFVVRFLHSRQQAFVAEMTATVKRRVS